MKLRATCLALVFLAALATLSGACSDQNACSGAASAGSAGSCSSSGNSAAGSSGADGGTLSSGCSSLLATIDACYKAFCAADGAGSPFCMCWTKNYDLDSKNCVCIAPTKASVCDGLDLSNFQPSDYNCSAATGSVATLCVSNTQTQ